MSLSIKSGVSLPPALAMAVMIQSVYDTYKECGFDCTITAGVDGTHSPGSLHYVGLAVDFRTRDINQGDQQKLRGKIKERLGPAFDVVLEKDHLHVELDPKSPINS